jgi:hypothetical protein
VITLLANLVLVRHHYKQQVRNYLFTDPCCVQYGRERVRALPWWSVFRRVAASLLIYQAVCMMCLRLVPIYIGLLIFLAAPTAPSEILAQARRGFSSFQTFLSNPKFWRSAMMTTKGKHDNKGSVYIPFREQGRRALISSCILVVVYWMTKSDTKPSSSPHTALLFDSHEQAALVRSEREQTSHGMVSHSNSHSLGFWLKDGLPDEYTPRIVWLMAWPESGEDYITESIQRVSNQSTATNYGEQVTLKNYFSIPIYPRHEEGPYWEGLAGQFGNKIRKLPQHNVLTLTHCSSRCFLEHCPPDEYYDESNIFFQESCCTTTAQVAPKGMLKSFHYPLDRVTKAIHLMRNPFHNVIQRFVKEREEHPDDDDKFRKEYPNLPKKGFQKWCDMMDDKYQKEDKKVYSKSLLKLAKKSICHAEFYKYVQWHNHAFRASADMETTMVVYYDDFHTNFEETTKRLVDMLEFPRVAQPYSFSPPHDYSRFYTLEMRKDIRNFVKAVASDVTWDHLKHYFESGNIEV